MIEYKVGLRLISDIFLNNAKSEGDYVIKGVIIKIIKPLQIELKTNIIIEWEKPDLIGVMSFDLKEKTSKVKYTKSMLDEAFSEGIIKIDKGYYRNKKLNELGI